MGYEAKCPRCGVRFTAVTLYTGPYCPACADGVKGSDGDYTPPDPSPSPPDPSPNWGSSASDFGTGGVSGADGG